ncbi:MAG TPA: hypothetical protein VFV19_16105 [Candidatus Polarisedimenticolaceae bacterium]|nr:hypothetical protein [Candidatus Polarisedimenticolaceae bacterium]
MFDVLAIRRNWLTAAAYLLLIAILIPTMYRFGASSSSSVLMPVNAVSGDSGKGGTEPAGWAQVELHGRRVTTISIGLGGSDRALQFLTSLATPGAHVEAVLRDTGAVIDGNTLFGPPLEFGLVKIAPIRGTISASDVAKGVIVALDVKLSDGTAIDSLKIQIGPSAPRTSDD